MSNTVITKSTISRLAILWIVVVIFLLGGNNILNSEMSAITATVAFIILIATIIGAAFGVVKEADALAAKLGEPYGTLILTLSIVSIEVILISSVMLGPGEVSTIGKDSIFSVMMIIMNLVMGLCMLLGGLKYGEQEYNAQGTMSYLSMIIMLGGISFLLPNFIIGAGGGAFSFLQALVISILIIVLYGLFLTFQTKGYSHLYIQPNKGQMEILFNDKNQTKNTVATSNKTNDKKELVTRTIILILMILPIVLLSHFMATVVDYGITAASLPKQLGGLLIAIIVFTPESMTAIKAALNNEFQRAINLCHGAFVSTVGLSVPAVLIIGLISDKTVLFGLTPTETILFIITLLLSITSFLGKRTTPFTGFMHLILFVVFVLLIFAP